MKIGVISNLYPPLIRGGAEVVAAMMAEGLKENWQHVFVISSKPYQSFKSWRTSKGEVNEVTVYRIYPPNFYHYLNDFRYPWFIRVLWHLVDSFNIFTYFKVKAILKKEQPEVIITHSLMGLGFLIPKLLRKLKIKHIHILHDVQLSTPSGLIIKGEENSRKHKIFKFLGYARLMKKLWQSPDLIISPSRYLLNHYKNLGFFPQSKLVVLPNPIKSAQTLTKKPNYNLQLLYLGQIHKAKGVLELIKNFRQLKLSGVRLHIAGVGTDLQKAKKLAKDDKRIRFYGWLNSQQILPLLSQTDIMIVPSLCYENSPTVIYESLNLGIPVLAADIGGTAELITEGKNGWIFPAGDFITLNKKIISLYQQRDKLSQLSANCRQSVQPYLLENYINKLLKLINEN